MTALLGAPAVPTVASPSPDEVFDIEPFHVMRREHFQNLIAHPADQP